MSILGRHVAYTLLRHTLTAMAVLLVLFSIVEFIELIENDSYGLDHVAILVLLSAPRMVYEFFPMAVLLGTVTGLAQLANHSELIVMQASGYSRQQITLASLRLGLAFFLCVILIGEFVTPTAEHWVQRLRQDVLRESVQRWGGSGLWLRDQNSFVHIGEVLPDFSVRNIHTFDFAEDMRLHSMLTAKEGVYQGNHWEIRDVQQTRINPADQPKASVIQSTAWQTRITPEILAVFLVQPEQLSFFQLRHYITYLAANQQQTDAFEYASWSRLVLPFSTAVMILLAIPFAFTNIRSRSVGRSLFIGILLGLGFFAANKGFGYAVLANGISPLIGATLPTIGILLLALVMLRRTP